MYWQNNSFQVPIPRLFKIHMAKNATQLLVMTSCKGSITAKKIANEVVSQNLGTSVHIMNGVNTFFRWVGKVENSEEQLLLIKTSSDSYADLEKCITRLHPHELPEIIAVPIYSGLTNIDAD
ncbi:MAG: periplasmic divalent cation tolerance protein [Gammaproteobacteria bacterium]|jgi:periplasmic divalent cation tolerance protein